MIVHVYKRALLSKKLDNVVVCCDDQKIFKIVKSYGGKAILTSKRHLNGTERIAEAYKILKKKYDLIIDIQGDEPLINPFQIDQVIKFHIKNRKADIILPSLKIPNGSVIKSAPPAYVSGANKICSFNSFLSYNSFCLSPIIFIIIVYCLNNSNLKY